MKTKKSLRDRNTTSLNKICNWVDIDCNYDSFAANTAMRDFVQTQNIQNCDWTHRNGRLYILDNELFTAFIIQHSALIKHNS